LELATGAGEEEEEEEEVCTSLICGGRIFKEGKTCVLWEEKENGQFAV
jgi:hypothetical protein